MLVELAKILGISGVIAGIFYLLYHQILSLEIFSKLTKRQTFWLLFTIAVMIWLFAVIWLFGTGDWVVIFGDRNQINGG